MKNFNIGKIVLLPLIVALALAGTFVTTQFQEVAHATDNDFSDGITVDSTGDAADNKYRKWHL